MLRRELATPSAASRPGMPARHRAAGFLGNLRLVHRRSGLSGLVELIVARALPNALSYQRTHIFAAPMVGELHPELAPRVVRSLDPSIERLYAQLARAGEPAAPGFAPDVLRGRFDSGHELWVFHLDGRIAHARWVVRDRLRFAGFSLPLGADERAGESAVTLAEFRRHDLSSAASAHVRAAMAKEGARTMLGAIDGFNRRFLEARLRSGRRRRVATVHVISLGRRRRLRADAASAPDAALLERRGLRTGCWIREPTS